MKEKLKRVKKLIIESGLNPVSTLSDLALIILIPKALCQVIEETAFVNIFYIILIAALFWIYFLLCRFSIRNKKWLEVLGIDQSFIQDVPMHILILFTLALLLLYDISRMDRLYIILISLTMIALLILIVRKSTEAVRKAIALAKLADSARKALRQYIAKDVVSDTLDEMSYESDVIACQIES